MTIWTDYILRAPSVEVERALFWHKHLSDREDCPTNPYSIEWPGSETMGGGAFGDDRPGVALWLKLTPPGAGLPWRPLGPALRSMARANVLWTPLRWTDSTLDAPYRHPYRLADRDSVNSGAAASTGFTHVLPILRPGRPSDEEAEPSQD